MRKDSKSSAKNRETFLIEITEEEFAQIPIKLRRRLSRRWMKVQRFMAALDEEEDP